MPSPVTINIAKDQWVKVATNVSHGKINIIEQTPLYYYTYRSTGDAAPTLEIEGVRIKNEQIAIVTDEYIDVYIWVKTKTGIIRVDT